MFHRFIISAALIAALGIGAAGWTYDWHAVQQYREEIEYLQDFCTEREMTATFATVERVVDGDTLKLADGQTVRLLGPDTPEICHHTAHGELREPDCVDEPWGQEAKAYTQKMVEGKEVILIGDPHEGNRDYFGRLLRYVYIGEKSLGLSLVRDGYAPVYEKLSPETKYYDEYLAAEIEAGEKERGMWTRGEL